MSLSTLTCFRSLAASGLALALTLWPAVQSNAQTFWQVPHGGEFFVPEPPPLTAHAQALHDAVNQRIVNIDSEQLYALLTQRPETVLIDVRTPAEIHLLGGHVEAMHFLNPVKYVVLENGQGHAMLGMSYWQAQGAKVIAHRDTAAHIEKNGHEVLETMRRRARDKAFRTELSKPDIVYEDRMDLSMGGWKIEVLHLGNAHHHGDTMVWLPEKKLVIPGHGGPPTWPPCGAGRATIWWTCARVWPRSSPASTPAGCFGRWSSNSLRPVQAGNVSASSSYLRSRSCVRQSSA